MMIQVTLKDDVKEFEAGVSAADVAKSIGAGLYKAACACRIDGEDADLRTPLTKDCTLEILTFDSAESIGKSAQDALEDAADDARTAAERAGK